MPTVDELKELANADPTIDPNYVNIIYGDFGKRKTVTACSMVNERGLLLSSDDSWKVLLNSRHREVFGKIKPVTLEGLKQLEYIDFDGFDTIIWDTFSRSVQTYLSILHKHSNWGGKYRERLNVNTRDLGEFEAPIVLENTAPVDYLATRDAFQPVLEHFYNLPAHIIFTSQLTEPIPGLSKDQRNRPAIPGATFQLIAERADIIAQLKPENRKFVADMSENLSTMLGKSRIEGLEGKMDLDGFITKYKEIVFK